MQKGLVSILTPCYNTGNYIHRLFDSVLSQTYDLIEMFVVDDGSSDDSASVIKSYIPKFKDRGYSLTYIYQENGGQSSAIKRGLSFINGEFLVWPDSDDFYASEYSIFELVNGFSSIDRSIYGMVRSYVRFVQDVTFSSIGVVGEKNRYSRTLFHDCLLCENEFYFASGAYMVDVNKLYELTKFDIFTSKNAGQNWQLLLPLLYKYQCLTIPVPLHNVVVRENSHSRGLYAGFDASLAKFSAYRDTLLGTIGNMSFLMSETEYSHYIFIIKQKYLKINMQLSFEFSKSNEYRIFYFQCKSCGANLKISDTIKYYIIDKKILRDIFSCFLTVRSFMVSGFRKLLSIHL